MNGKLILLAGPSGSGKGTLFAHVRTQFPDFFYPASWTTRAPRENEKDGASTGKPYHFVSTEEFKKAIDENAMLEWDHHFLNYYGTHASEVEVALTAGRTVFHELEIRGIRQLLEKIPREQVKILFIDAGSWDDLKRRIEMRAPIPENEMETRYERYCEEVLFKDNADYVIQNPDGGSEQAKKDIEAAIREIIAL